MIKNAKFPCIFELPRIVGLFIYFNPDSTDKEMWWYGLGLWLTIRQKSNVQQKLLVSQETNMLQLQSIQFLLVILIPSIFISDSNVIAQAPDRPDLLLRCRSIDKPYHFIKDPVSCNGYYLCFNGTVSPGDCQIGLHFNEQEQICDSPSKVRCADLECPRHIGFIPRRNSCKQFHLCSQGIVIRDFECPNGSHFDVIEERCNYPEVVQCGRDVCPQQTDAFDIIMRPHPDECGK